MAQLAAAAGAAALGVAACYCSRGGAASNSIQASSSIPTAAGAAAGEGGEGGPGEAADDSGGLVAAVREQIEHYLGDENLPKDEFLLGARAPDPQQPAQGQGCGLWAVDTLAASPRLAKLLQGQDAAGRERLIAAAVEGSGLLRFGVERTAIGRCRPLPRQPRTLAEFMASSRMMRDPR